MEMTLDTIGISMLISGLITAVIMAVIMGITMKDAGRGNMQFMSNITANDKTPEKLKQAHTELNKFRADNETIQHATAIRVISSAKTMISSMKELYDITAYVIKESGLHVGTVKKGRMLYDMTGTSSAKNTPEIYVVFSTKQLNNNWFNVSEVYWTKEDARLAILTKTHDMLSDADEILIAPEERNNQ